MSKFSIDYSQLDTVGKKIYKLADVKDRLEKIGFDIVKFKGGNPDELWQIQSSDDGDFIVARYDSEEHKEASNQDWNVLVSNASSEINIFYKSHPIKKIAIAAEDLSSVKSFLPTKLATDKAFVKALISSLDCNAKELLFKQYPELF